ncbi:hypothetical protein C1645_829820 [Glomus cerebriforme]|uniref:BHLH domain-containing protein n=1 Tax=Glomus cerebriforme TaxID=658196 RepID=A0A397SJ73_9GLOM|nr:hypothetical protein C1645_829820 [Glomus cerebriforme]
MATFPNFDNSGLNSNPNEVDLNFDINDLNFNFFESQQRQTTNNNRNNGSANPLVSSTMTSQAPHNYYSNMLPTPEGSDSLIMSPFNMLPGSEHLTIEDAYKDDDFYLESPEGVSFYISSSLMSPQTSPTLPPDASMNITNITSPTRRNKKPKISTNHQKISMSQSRKRSININGNNSNNDNKNNNSSNGQYNANTDLPSIMTGSPSNSIAMFSLLELTSPLMNNMVATSIAPSLQETMPNLSLGSNLVSDVTNTHSSTSISDLSSDKIAPITPSSLMKMKKKPNSPKSGQDESQQQLQQQQLLQQTLQKKQDQSQQLQLTSNDRSTFIAPTPPTQLNQIRTNVVVTTGAASPSGKKSIRSNPNASSPLALGPSKSPHSLKPTISPNLKPKLPGVLADEVAEQLANKSNYRSILEGTAKSLGISYSSDVHSSLESRRTTHKAAEQKRRDSLKQSFDELKKVIPYQSTSSKSNGSDGNTNNNGKSNSNSNGKSDGTMKNVSKLFLLKRAHDYIVELEQKSKEKDVLIQKLNDELDDLKGVKRRKIEETEKENTDNEIDTETKSKDEQQMTSSDEC